MQEQQIKHLDIIERTYKLEELRIKNVNDNLVNRQLTIANIINSYTVFGSMAEDQYDDTGLFNRVTQIRKLLVSELCDQWLAEDKTTQRSAEVIVDDDDKSCCDLST